MTWSLISESDSDLPDDLRREIAALRAGLRIRPRVVLLRWAQGPLCFGLTGTESVFGCSIASIAANVEMLSAELLKREARFDRVHQKLLDDFLDLFKMVGRIQQENRHKYSVVSADQPTVDKLSKVLGKEYVRKNAPCVV